MKTISSVVAVVSLVHLLVSVRAQDFSRAGMFEVGAAAQWFSGETVDAEINGRGGELELDELFGGGLSFGYHFTDRLAVSTDFIISRADLSFAGAGIELHDDADFLAWTVNLDYYILPARFTPYVSAGLGLLSLDNEYEDDYWFYFFPRDRELPVSEVDFLWNVGAGLRWDPMDHLYLKLGYRLLGSELEYSDEHMFVHSVMLTVGYSFFGP